MASLLIRNGRVFDGMGFVAGDVLVQDGVIAKIAPGLTETSDRVFDAAGMTVLPGLVDVHLHIKGVSSSGWCVDAFSPVICFLWREMLRSAVLPTMTNCRHGN